MKNTKILAAKFNFKGELEFTTNNEDLKPFLTTLAQILEKEIEYKYVRVVNYSVKFGNRMITFEFENANSLEEAIKYENYEKMILRDIQEALEYKISKNELKENLEKNYTNKNLFNLVLNNYLAA